MGVTALSPRRGKALVVILLRGRAIVCSIWWEASIGREWYRLVVAGAISAVSCALSFLFRCHIEVFRSWLIFLGVTHVLVVHRRHC